MCRQMASLSFILYKIQFRLTTLPQTYMYSRLGNGYPSLSHHLDAFGVEPHCLRHRGPPTFEPWLHLLTARFLYYIFALRVIKVDKMLICFLLINSYPANDSRSCQTRTTKREVAFAQTAAKMCTPPCDGSNFGKKLSISSTLWPLPVVIIHGAWR